MIVEAAAGAGGTESLGARGTDLSPADGTPRTCPVGHPWWALAVVGISQLMVVLDGTIVNVALPNIQDALQLSDSLRSGVVTSYALTFGGFLILCGRLSDRWGHRRTFLLALVGFGATSALGGLAPSPAVLFLGRALQGVCAAALVPSGLALLSTTFPERSRRSKAFGVHGAIAAAGAAIGLAGGGVLTGAFGWRWCFLINVPIAAVAMVAGSFLLPRSGSDRTVRPGALGSLLLTGGLAFLIGGCALAPEFGVSDPRVLALGLVGLLCLTAFVLHQQHSARPLVPPHLLADRHRTTALAAVAASTISGFGMFLVLTFFLQNVLLWSPAATGVAFLPLTGAIVLTTQVCARLVTRVPPQWLMLPGLAAGVAGMFWLSRLQSDSYYSSGVLPVLLLMGCSQGLLFLPALNSLLVAAAPRESGVAGATVSAAQQVGGALGTGLINAVAVGVAGTAVGVIGAAGTAETVVRGYGTAATAAMAVSLAAGAALAWAWMSRPGPKIISRQGV